GLEHLARLVALALDEGRRDHAATVGESGVDLGDLQRRRRHAVTVGYGLLGGAVPRVHRRQYAGGLAGEAAARLHAEAEAAHELVVLPVGQHVRDLGGADVGALGDHAGDAEHAV